ncbi:MAG: hypothetical protein AMXMBFR84_04200 [Candidatus Hydrogenedentota bacterium]
MQAKVLAICSAVFLATCFVSLADCFTVDPHQCGSALLCSSLSTDRDAECKHYAKERDNFQQIPYCVTPAIGQVNCNAEGSSQEVPCHDLYECDLGDTPDPENEGWYFCERGDFEGTFERKFATLSGASCLP